MPDIDPLAFGEVGKGLTYHGLRHTVAKHLADAGCDTRDIQAWLGHATAQITTSCKTRADTAAKLVLRRDDPAAKSLKKRWLGD